MRKGTQLSNMSKRLVSRLCSLVLAPLVRWRNSRRGPRIPNTSAFAAYFADTAEGAYQLEQWLPAFQKLVEAGSPVTLLIKDSSVANRLISIGVLPVKLCSNSADVDDFVSSHQVQVLFYVNNNQANFTPLRINGLIHVHLSHGESEKSSMVSHQLKAYDKVFIAGSAAQQRILAHIRGITPSNLVEIGRPQLDFHTPPPQVPADKIVVLYAPTWEGDSPAMAYSSLAGSGRKLAQLFGADDRVVFVFRPHPKTGTRAREYSEARRQIRHLLRLRAGYGRFKSCPKVTTDAISEISGADVVIADVSAIAMDAVGLDKPTVLITKLDTSTKVNTSQLASAVTTWSTVPTDAVEQILRMASEGPTKKQQLFREYVFGDDKDGTRTSRFVQAAQALL